MSSGKLKPSNLTVVLTSFQCLWIFLCVVEVLVLKTLKCLTLCLLAEQRLQCLHNADCPFWEVLPPVLLVEKHVACLPLMDVWLLPALFLHHRIHVAIFYPLPFMNPLYKGIGLTRMAWLAFSNRMAIPLKRDLLTS